MAATTESRGIVLVTAAALAICCAACPAYAHQAPTPEPPRKSDTHGPGVSAGIGSPYVGTGFQLAYYLPVPKTLFRVAPYAALGWVLWSFGPDDSEDSWVLGTTAGALTSWGRKHRLAVDLYYGAAGTTSLSLHGEPPDTELEWGPGAAVGYEYAADSGFFLRTSFGLHYVVTAPILAPVDRIVFGGTLIGLGYKLW